MISGMIVAAGLGTRMGPNADKLFLPIGGQPLVAHTWRLLDECRLIDQIVLVVRDGAQDRFNELHRRFRFRTQFRLAAGGPERQDSVWNGLQALAPGCEIVVIQDGARPCTPPALVQATIEAARASGAAVAAQRVTDTIKESDGTGQIARTLNRARLWAVQTPQTFRVEVIRRALTAVREKGVQVTDDTAACELIGQPVKLIESPAANPKATSPADLPYLELLLRQR
jgi:2-C-methyl-D-erythritol 4-phosphate cytidylyltransferase